jgi:hypothetical protein
MSNRIQRLLLILSFTLPTMQTALAEEAADSIRPDLSCERVFDRCDACDCWISGSDGCDLFNGNEPAWELSANFIMLQRVTQGAPMVRNILTGNTLLSANQFNSGYVPGFELEGRRRFGNVIADVRYFQVDSMNANLSGSTTGLDVFFTDYFFPAITPAFASYGSNLNSVEFNLLAESDGPIRPLVGFRYLHYSEQATISAPVLGFGWGTRTLNDLFGFQIGGEADLFQHSRRFQVTAIGKAGIYGVSSQSQAYLAVPILPPVSSAKDHAGSAAFLGELGLNATYTLTRWLAIQAGYRVMFLDGVAMAGEQYSTTHAPNLPGTLQSTRINNGDVFLHGFNVGLVANW